MIQQDKTKINISGKTKQTNRRKRDQKRAQKIGYKLREQPHKLDAIIYM